ncbi:hypothetical protein [Nocardia exalbida]|nr:hypothetical protein [Nocardia exalbida]
MDLPERVPTGRDAERPARVAELVREIEALPPGAALDLAGYC